MAKKCTICRNEKKQGSFLSRVFSRNGSTQDLHLCREHDIEFFKMGQVRFISKYKLQVKNDDDILEDSKVLQYEDLA